MKWKNLSNNAGFWCAAAYTCLLWASVATFLALDAHFERRDLRIELAQAMEEIAQLKEQVQVAQASADQYAEMISQMEIQRREYSAKKDFLISYIQARNPHIGTHTAAVIADTFISAGEEFNIDPLFLAAQASVESAFQVYARSPKSAVGVMQVVPSIWVPEIEWLENEDDLFNIHINIRAGAHILDHYRNRCGGRLDKALSCYHGGLRALKSPRASTIIYRERVLARWKTLELM